MTPDTTRLHAIGGLHHVTAITADAQANINFYTQTLGLRLVKVTVNYDDPSSYHLYYGDRLGTPGSLLTFFVWPGGFAGKHGTGQVSHTAYAIPVASIDFWRDRLAALQTPATESVRFGQQVLALKDPDGLDIELIASAAGEPDPNTLWVAADIPAQHAIRGFHSVTLAEARIDEPSSVLVNHFGYRPTMQDGNRYRFELDAPGAHGTIVDVVALGQRQFTGGGTGSVHHVAFRTPNDEQQQTWLDTLLQAGAHVSPIMDRDYFHSIYFREPGGVLFEIATDNPGMTINETVENLGTRLALPKWMEYARAQIEKSLTPIQLPTAATAVTAGAL